MRQLMFGHRHFVQYSELLLAHPSDKIRITSQLFKLDWFLRLNQRKLVQILPDILGCTLDQNRLLKAVQIKIIKISRFYIRPPYFYGEHLDPLLTQGNALRSQWTDCTVR